MGEGAIGGSVGDKEVGVAGALGFSLGVFWDGAGEGLVGVDFLVEEVFKIPRGFVDPAELA